jgi:hypothetical protein
LNYLKNRISSLESPPNGETQGYATWFAREEPRSRDCLISSLRLRLNAQDEVPAVAVWLGHHVAVYAVAFLSLQCATHRTNKFQSFSCAVMAYLYPVSVEGWLRSIPAGDSEAGQRTAGGKT